MGIALLPLDLADGEEAKLIEGLSHLVGNDCHEHCSGTVGNVVELHFACGAGRKCLCGRRSGSGGCGSRSRCGGFCSSFLCSA